MKAINAFFLAGSLFISSSAFALPMAINEGGTGGGSLKTPVPTVTLSASCYLTINSDYCHTEGKKQLQRFAWTATDVTYEETLDMTCEVPASGLPGSTGTRYQISIGEQVSILDSKLRLLQIDSGAIFVNDKDGLQVLTQNMATVIVKRGNLFVLDSSFGLNSSTELQCDLTLS